MKVEAQIVKLEPEELSIALLLLSQSISGFINFVGKLFSFIQ